MSEAAPIDLDYSRWRAAEIAAEPHIARCTFEQMVDACRDEAWRMELFMREAIRSPRGSVDLAGIVRMGRIIRAAMLIEALVPYKADVAALIRPEQYQRRRRA